MAAGWCWFLRKMRLLFACRTGEIASPAPVCYKDRRAFRIFLATINRISPIRIEVFETGRPIVLPGVKSIIRTGFLARDITALAGLKIFRRMAGWKAVLDQYRT